MIKNEPLIVCSLCHEASSNCEPLEGLKNDMLDLAVPKNDIINTTKPLVCTTCSESLTSVFEFKSRCLESENDIRNYVSPIQGKIDLKTVINKKSTIKIDPDLGPDSPDDYEVCRFCFKKIQKGDEFYRCSDHMDMLKECVPDVNLAYTNNPVICNTCYTLVKKMLTFLSASRNREARKRHIFTETDQTFIVKTEISLDDVKIENFLDESCSVGITNSFRGNCFENVKIKEECNTNSMHRTINETSIPEAHADIADSEVSCKVPAIISTFPEISTSKAPLGIFRTATRANSQSAPKRPNSHKIFCDKCSFSTYYAWIFEAHLSEHKDVTETTTPSGETLSDAKTYFCSACNFKCDNLDNIQKHLVKVHTVKRTCTLCKGKNVYVRIRSHMMKNHCLTTTVKSRKSLDAQFKCDECACCFWSHTGLRVHKTRKH